MKIIAKEGQVVISGRIGTINPKTDTLTDVSIFAFKDDSVRVAMDPSKHKIVEYLEVGQYVTVVAYAKQNGEYTNYYANFIEAGPKSRKNTEQ